MASSSRESQDHGQEYRSSKVKVTILASEWGSSKGGLSTLNRELAIQLAKSSSVEITFFVPQCSDEDKKEALLHNVHIIKATRLAGYEELEWLSSPPPDLQIDVIVGHGVKLGRQAQIVRKSHKCKWVQVIHTDPEELGMFKSYPNPISTGEQKHCVEVELCELADFVVGVGPKLSEAFRVYLRWCEKDLAIFDFTPGLFNEFTSVKQVPDESGKHRSVLVFGRGDADDFELKGFDIAGRAVASLPDSHLLFFGAPDGKLEDVAQRFLDCDVPANRLRVRSYDESRESLKRLFCEVDLVLMPSRTDGFGLTGLEALSAGLPVLVSQNSGFGEALSKVAFGSSFVIDSEDPQIWAAAIKKTWAKERQIRIEEAEVLRASYERKYSWTKQSDALLFEMTSLVGTRLPIQIDCEAIRGPAAQGEAKGVGGILQNLNEAVHRLTGAFSASNKQQPVVSTEQVETESVSVSNGGIPSAQTVLNFIAFKYFQEVDPSKPEQLNGYLQYLEKVRNVLFVHAQVGSLIITVEIGSLQILEELWRDYRTGHLNKMAQNFLVTADVLKEFGLTEVRLTTTIAGEAYRACQNYFSKRSDVSSCLRSLGQKESEMKTEKSEKNAETAEKLPRVIPVKRNSTSAAGNDNRSSIGYNKSVKKLQVREDNFEGNSEEQSTARPAYTRLKKNPKQPMVMKRFEVSKDLKGRVIGKGGWVIKEIVKSSGAVIRTGRADDRFTVSGNMEQCEHAKELILEKMQKIRKGSTPADLIEVPDEYKGLVIGKGGDNLRHISTLTGAKTICKEGELHVVSGTDEQRQHAKALARLKGLESEFNKAYRYVDGLNLPVNCRLKLEPLVQEDRMLLPGPHAQYRLRPAEDYELEHSCCPRDEPSYLLKLKYAALESLRQIKLEMKTKEYLMLDMWCHFGPGIIRGPDEEEANEGEWTIDEVNEKFQPSSDGNSWRTSFNQGVNLNERIFEDYTCEKTSEEYIARYDLTFLTPGAHQIRCKVWVAKKNVGKNLEDIEVPFSEVKNILEEIHFEDEATRSRCRGWLVLPSRRYLQADILFPGCEFDCRLTIRGGTESGLVTDYLPNEDVRRTLSRYLSELTVTEEDGSGLCLPEMNKPEGFHLIHKRCSRRSLYEISEGFAIILSEESTRRSDGTTEEARESTDLHLRCKEWDKILKSGEWEPETIVEKIPEFFQFVRKVQDFVLREMKRTCNE